ncbi:HAD family hydrolase [Vulgatibacter incomptus]|uniref:phosphoglycolate phosphatase n=1 Tax=Vulgatibacter incomptus TaxID=1391653 RepID=A0A0K1PA00_9BACT|nr:HAD family hydrolase [Vulgatibacter incomptus]AKU89944.1 hydrolase, haloacid dehalogenase-like family [Vulgatibacter incomptus]
MRSSRPDRNTVLLFDIDGTLVSTGGCGRRAIERAFERAFGRKGEFSFPFDGMTDRAIVRQALMGSGLPADEATIDGFLPVYIATLEEEVAVAPWYRLHHGMREAVETAASRSGFAVGLGTGNVKDGARVKLQRVGIHDAFRFGGFGCDHEERPALIRRGAERGAEQLGVPLSECRVVIIGDTPKDIAAARAMGAESIGVGTGSFGPAQLLACGATHAFRDFSQDGALDALLVG